MAWWNIPSIAENAWFLLMIMFSFCVCFWGEKWLYGCWFYRPNETFHLATRKFLEKEVFKSDYYNKVPVSKILGKCVVMFVKVRSSLIPKVLIIPWE
jgi:hypothetical protein